MNLLITGGLGFIGSNLIRLVLETRPGWRITNLDLMTYAANPSNLAGIGAADRYRWVRGDIADRDVVSRLFSEERFDAVIHCAAETHVDRSLTDGGRFLRTNVEGTLVLLDHALDAGIRHVQVSTDEVYGSLGPADAPFSETTPLAPRSPYSASKAAADQMALAYHHTHGLDVVVTRCSNNFGPYQDPEKLIPLMITSALRGLPLPVYGDGRQRRDWIHVLDHCRAILRALEAARPGTVYNFGGGAERTNLEVVRAIVDLVGADEELVAFVADRPGHDRRYAVSFERAERELGWRPEHEFRAGLEQTVDWYRENVGWWSERAGRAYLESRERIAAWDRRG